MRISIRRATYAVRKVTSSISSAAWLAELIVVGSMYYRDCTFAAGGLSVKTTEGGYSESEHSECQWESDPRPRP